MFKTVISALAFVFLVALIVLSIKKVPQVQELAECYSKTKEVYAQENIVSRRAYTKEETICARNKRLILQGAQCFYRTEQDLPVLEGELPYLKMAAKTWARTSKELDEVIAEHNDRCVQEEAGIEPHELKELQGRYVLP